MVCVKKEMYGNNKFFLRITFRGWNEHSSNYSEKSTLQFSKEYLVTEPTLALTEK